jgi:hypothetical protein
VPQYHFLIKFLNKRLIKHNETVDNVSEEMYLFDEKENKHPKNKVQTQNYNAMEYTYLFVK